MGINTWLGGLLGSAGASGVSEVVNGIGDAALKVRSAITGNLTPDKAAEVELHLADLEAQIAEAQNKVNEVDASSPSFFIAGARPAAMWVCVFGLAYSFLIQPFLEWASVNFGWVQPPVIDTGTILTLITGMLGLSGYRTFEKTKGIHNEH